MSLIVHTARISTRDPDRLDVTRKSGGKAGHPFAPSWGILRPALAARRRVEDQANFGDASDVQRAEADMERAWVAYVAAYTAEMRESYRANRAAWDGLLARSRVVLVCYCAAPERCHRTLLALNILPKLGATYAGELS